MERITIGVIEARFADLVWEKEPVTTKELVKLCEKEFNWKRTTTYTVLKRLCERGLFLMQDSIVTSLLSRDEFYAIQSEQFVEQTFKGSLPDFLAAFSSRKKPTAEELETLRHMIDVWGGEKDV